MSDNSLQCVKIVRVESLKDKSKLVKSKNRRSLSKSSQFRVPERRDSFDDDIVIDSDEDVICLNETSSAPPPNSCNKRFENVFVKQEGEKKIKSDKNCTFPEGQRKEAFLHFELDNERKYYYDRKWADEVKTHILRKYDAAGSINPKDERMAKFFITVSGFTEIPTEGRIVEVAVEALYLKTLYQNCGVASVATWLIKSISCNTFSVQLMIYLYLMHIIMSMERRFIKSPSSTMLYAKQFEYLNFCPLFKSIVTKAPPKMKKELFALRLRWNYFFSATALKEVDGEDFWVHQGLNTTFMKYKLEHFQISMKKAAESRNQKKEVRKTEKVERGSDWRTNSNNGISGPDDDVIEVVSVDVDYDSSSSIEVVQEIVARRKKSTKRKLESEEEPFGGGVATPPPTNNSPSPTMQVVPRIVHNSLRSLGTGGSCPGVTTTAIKTVMVPQLEGKTKKTMEELQQMLERRKIGTKAKNPPRQLQMANSVLPGSIKVGAARRNISRKLSRSGKEIQIANVMSKEFVDNLLTPTLANFEIVYGEDGTAKTKFTHVA